MTRFYVGLLVFWAVCPVSAAGEARNLVKSSDVVGKPYIAARRHLESAGYVPEALEHTCNVVTRAFCQRFPEISCSTESCAATFMNATRERYILRVSFDLRATGLDKLDRAGGM